jgi:hypothetical protein
MSITPHPLDPRYPQSAGSYPLLRLPLESMSNGNRKRRTPLKHALWFALGVVVGWLTHALFTA